MRTPWKLSDIVDYEYFQNVDQDIGEAELHCRDRDFYLRLQQGGDAPGNLSRRRLLRLWLSERRTHHPAGLSANTPGRLIDLTLALLRKLMALKGLVVGVVAGLSFFTYSGETPVNVFHFLLLFVGTQLLFALLAIAGCSLRLLFPRAALPSLITSALRIGFRRLLPLVQRSLAGRRDDHTGTAWTLAVDTLTGRNTSHGALFYWPLFSVLQRFAIFCNLGIATATLTKVAFSDLAFGWQSTLQFGADALHKAVTMAALPWSWLFPGNGGHPGLAEIEGSRIILKDGIGHLATADLVSWWPFLVLCLIVYGLLPRLAFAMGGRLLEERTLAGLDFDSPSGRAVVRRMKTPLLSSQAAPEQPGVGQEAPSAATESDSERSPDLLPQFVLVPDDIFGLCPKDKLEPLLAACGFAIKGVHTFMTGYDEDEEIKVRLAAELRRQGLGVLILMEGWMPPLVAFLTYLRELRDILPENTPINVALVGRPLRSGFSPLSPADLALWQKKTGGAKDPNLYVFPLTSRKNL